MKKRALQSVVLGVSIGAADGLGAYTFIYAKGGSYLTNNPASCATRARPAISGLRKS